MSTFVFALFFIGLGVLCVWVIIDAIKHPTKGIGLKAFNKKLRESND
jgi:hypothetical protein